MQKSDKCHIENDVWDSEIFPYSTIEKLRKEFIETVRDQNEPMEYGGDWYKNRTSKGASLDVLFIAFTLAVKTVTVYHTNISAVHKCFSFWPCTHFFILRYNPPDPRIYP